MTFLPIVSRELRVASRRVSTFYGRSIIASVSIVIGGFLLFMAEVLNPTGGKGGSVFVAVSSYAWLIAMLAGVFLASDCISEERREGTLGFLFLTDLKGYDVVLGKFAGVSLNAFYGMLAVFPVLAISMLAGGVTAGEFWRTCLALVNTLFFSVAASMWVSTVCKSSTRGMIIAICVLVGFLALWAVASSLSSVFPKLDAPLFCLGALSPLSSFSRASAANYLYRSGEFWASLAISHGAGWVFLGLASWRLAFFTEKGEEKKRGWQRTLTRSVLGTRTERQAELLSINPVLWLVGESGRLRWIVWALAILGGGTLLLVSVLARPFGVMAITSIGWPFYFLLKVFFAIQTCRFFSEARRSGALELLCCTPMTMRSIISGQWMALSRIFLWPVTILIICQFACFCFLGDSIYSLFKTAATVVTAKGVSAAVAPQPPVGFMGGWFSIMVLKQIANSIADFFAVGWFGMWLALTLRKPGSATGLTILYVLVLPTVAFCVPTLATDAVFIVVGYSKLQQDFRSPAIASRNKPNVQ